MNNSKIKTLFLVHRKDLLDDAKTKRIEDITMWDIRLSSLSVDQICKADAIKFIDEATGDIKYLKDKFKHFTQD